MEEGIWWDCFIIFWTMPWRPTGESGRDCGLKDVIIRVMCHNIFYSAIQDITELVYGIPFYVAVMSQPVQLRAVHTVSGI